VENYLITDHEFKKGAFHIIPRVGLMLYGSCNGFFGRDSYGPKRIEALGANWVVIRDENGAPDFAYFDSPEALELYLARWSQQKEEA
jgi:hypothetical protein